MAFAALHPQVSQSRLEDLHTCPPLMSTRYTKAVISKRDVAPAAEVHQSLAPLRQVEERYAALYASLPRHLTFSEKGVFLHSTQPEFATYISLHTWYLQGCCDLYRICLPGAYRESASSDFLKNAPTGFVTKWQALAVSYAWKLATIWQRLLELKRTGALTFPGNFVPLNAEGIMTIHQCTKILLVGRKFQLFSGLVDPITQEPITLNEEASLALCNSNVTFLDDLASIAPIAAVVQRDIKSMIDEATRGNMAADTEAPVSSEIQQDKILSRYHVVSMGLAASNEPDTAGLVGADVHQGSTNQQQPAHSGSAQQLEHQRRLAQTQPNSAFTSSIPQQPGYIQNKRNEFNVALAGDGFNNGFWPPPAVAFGGELLPGHLALDYNIAASQTDMDGELSWFLSHGMQ